MTSRRALVCAPLPPEFDRESGSQRLHHLIEFLREDGWAVSFVARNEATGTRHMRMLRQDGVATYGQGDRQLDALVQVGRFDLAILAFWHLAAMYLPRIRALSPSTRVIVDSVDVHFLRQARAAFSRARSNGVGALDGEYARELTGELNTYAASDGVLTVSQKEADLLNDFADDRRRALAHAVPLCAVVPAVAAPLENRRGMLFLGNFRHPPNLDALKYLADAIAPRLNRRLLRKHPVSIVGNGVNNAVIETAGQIPYARLVGWVPSVVPYFEHARISIAPLRYGAGTKGKVVQSLMLGTPCVTTGIGAEGLALIDRQEVLIADDPPQFADAVAELVSNARLWRSMSIQGQAAMRRSHDRALVKARFLQVVDEVLSRRPRPPMPNWDSWPVPNDSGYSGLVERVRNIILSTTPPNSKVLVVSKGDERLVSVADRVAWHFPRGVKGGYAGFYPASGLAAVTHLETLRARGAQFLVVPQTSLWWLDHYADLKKHLDASAKAIWSTSECVIFRLAARPATAAV